MSVSGTCLKRQGCMRPGALSIGGRLRFPSGFGSTRKSPDKGGPGLFNQAGTYPITCRDFVHPGP